MANRRVIAAIIAPGIWHRILNVKARVGHDYGQLMRRLSQLPAVVLVVGISRPAAQLFFAQELSRCRATSLGSRQADQDGSTMVDWCVGPQPRLSNSWCGREDLNLHTPSGTCTSSMRVCQFRHDRVL